jgi:nitrogen fixation NifU-like protein
MLTELALGKSLAEVEAMNAADFVEALGREIVINRLRCATLALNTLKAAEKKYRAGQQARSAAEAAVENF